MGEHMSALPTGSHTLTISLVIRRPKEAERFKATCSCGERHGGAITRVRARELHDAHIQAVLSETEANDV